MKKEILNQVLEPDTLHIEVDFVDVNIRPSEVICTKQRIISFNSECEFCTLDNTFVW